MYYFVVNPASRSGKGLKIWEKTEEILKEKKIEYESYILTAPGEAREMAQFLSLNKTPCTVVIVGGDGTINEFLSGLPTFEGITLGYLPTGSGNDFARGMHLPAKPEDALDLILNPEKFRHINIGITSSGDEKKYFAISSGIGFDAAICYESNASALKSILNKIHAGKLIYLINALRMLFALKPCSMRVLLDDSQLLTFQKVYFVTAMNMKYEGGGFMFCPKQKFWRYFLLLFLESIRILKGFTFTAADALSSRVRIKPAYIWTENISVSVRKCPSILLRKN